MGCVDRAGSGIYQVFSGILKRSGMVRVCMPYVWAAKMHVRRIRLGFKGVMSIGGKEWGKREEGRGKVEM